MVQTFGAFHRRFVIVRRHGEQIVDVLLVWQRDGGMYLLLADHLKALVLVIDLFVLVWLVVDCLL